MPGAEMWLQLLHQDPSWLHLARKLHPSAAGHGSVPRWHHADALPAAGCRAPAARMLLTVCTNAAGSQTAQGPRTEPLPNTLVRPSRSYHSSGADAVPAGHTVTQPLWFSLGRKGPVPPRTPPRAPRLPSTPGLGLALESFSKSGASGGLGVQAAALRRQKVKTGKLHVRNLLARDE